MTLGQIGPSPEEHKWTSHHEFQVRSQAEVDSLGVYRDRSCTLRSGPMVVSTAPGEEVVFGPK